MATPSTLGSQVNSRDSSSSEGSCRRRRSPQARTSSSLKALSRLIIGARWRTSRKRPDGAAPTEFVGESGVAKTGYSDSRRRSSRTRRSYSASGISGASRVWYSVLWCWISRGAPRPPAPSAGRRGSARVLRSGHAQAAIPAPTRALRICRASSSTTVSVRAPPAAAGRRSAPRARSWCPIVHRTGRPCALTWAMARSPTPSGRSTQVSHRRGQQDRRAHHLLRRAHGDAARHDVDRGHVATPAVRPVAHAAALTDGDQLDGVDLSGGRPAPSTTAPGCRSIRRARNRADLRLDR